MRKNAFTILELSIVMLMISLLIASITVGKSMITQATIRSVIIEINEISKATNSFHTQFNYWPGDWMNSDNSVSSFGSGYNFGNGNNIIESTATGCSASGIAPESILAWKHMYDTDNYAINLSGTSPGSITCIKIGQNVPKSKVKGGFYYLWNIVANGTMFGINKGNIIHFGSISSYDQSVNGSILSAIDGKSLDNKIDDGVANTGSLFGIDGNEVATNSCSASWNSLGSDYNYSNNNVVCRFVYRLEN